MSSNIEKIERLTSQLKRFKNEAKHATKIGVTSTLVVGGGALAGAIAAKMPFVPRTNVPMAGAVGSGLVLAAMSGMLDEHSDNAAMLGAGMLAAVMARETEKILTAA